MADSAAPSYTGAPMAPITAPQFDSHRYIAEFTPCP